MNEIDEMHIRRLFKTIDEIVINFFQLNPHLNGNLKVSILGKLIDKMLYSFIDFCAAEFKEGEKLTYTDLIKGVLKKKEKSSAKNAYQPGLKKLSKSFLL